MFALIVIEHLNKRPKDRSVEPKRDMSNVQDIKKNMKKVERMAEFFMALEGVVFVQREK